MDQNLRSRGGSILTHTHLVKTTGEKQINMFSSDRFPLKPTGEKKLKQMEVMLLLFWASMVWKSLGPWTGQQNLGINAPPLRGVGFPI